MTQDNELLNVSEARQRLLEHFSAVEAEAVPLTRSVGRILAEDIQAAFNLPPFPNSAMDGFAVRWQDVVTAGDSRPVSLNVVGDILAGDVGDLELRPGQAVRIMTGAPVPASADAVVPVENTDFTPRQAGLAAPATVSIFRPAARGEHIRPAGQDVRQGEVVLLAGSRIRPQDAGFLGMLGNARVPVRRKPRVVLFSTGDELLAVDALLQPGKIYDANTYVLTGLAEESGAEVINLGIVPDRPESVQATLDQAVAEGVDLIVSSAGVSVGAMDYVRSVVERNGELSFWRVNMRPGKPLAFGRYGHVPFIGLPGNPVSAFVGFEVFVRPALLKMLGLANTDPPLWHAILTEAVASDGRESYLRGIVYRRNGELFVRLTGHQGSGNLRSLVQANALLFIPSGVKSLPFGAQVSFWLLGDIQDETKPN
jgi:molybdopterin molybdotransferase